MKKLPLVLIALVLFASALAYGYTTLQQIRQTNNDPVNNPTLPITSISVTPSPTVFPQKDSIQPLWIVNLLTASENYPGEFSETNQIVVDSMGNYLGDCQGYDYDRDSNPHKCPEFFADSTKSTTTNNYELDSIAAESDESQRIDYYFSSDQKYVVKELVKYASDGAVIGTSYLAGPNNNKVADLKVFAFFKENTEVQTPRFVGFRNGNFLMFETTDTCKAEMCDGYQYTGAIYEYNLAKKISKHRIGNTISNMRINPNNTVVTKNALLIEQHSGGGPYILRLDLTTNKTLRFLDSIALADSKCNAWLDYIVDVQAARVIFPRCTVEGTFQLMQYSVNSTRVTPFSKQITLQHKNSNATLDLFSAKSADYIMFTNEFTANESTNQELFYFSAKTGAEAFHILNSTVQQVSEKFTVVDRTGKTTEFSLENVPFTFDRAEIENLL